MKFFQVPLVLLLGVSADAISDNRLRGHAEVNDISVGHRRLVSDSVSPATYSATLGIGEIEEILKSVVIGDAAPTSSKVDVFFLTDSTGSMGSLIANVKASAATILADASALGDVAFGVGEYRDIFDAFVYRTNQDITTSTTDAQAGINAWFAGGGGDRLEAQLFALKQVADTASWRPDSKRILVWFGDEPGHDPRAGVGLADTIAALNAKNIVVQALDLRQLNESGQAVAITDATGGTYYASVNPADIVSAIASAITDVFATYSSVKLQAPSSLTGVGVSILPGEITGDFSRESPNNFDFSVTFDCLEKGTFEFEILVLVDGGQVATELDTITCCANEILGFTLIDADNDLELGALGNTVDLNDNPSVNGYNFKTEITYCPDDPIDSCLVCYDDTVRRGRALTSSGGRCRCEKNAPYAVFGDVVKNEGVVNYFDEPLALGTHTVSAKCFTSPDCSGTAISEKVVKEFDVVDTSAPSGDGECQIDCDLDSDCSAGLLCADQHKSQLQACGFDQRKAYCGEENDYSVSDPANVKEACFDPNDARLVAAGCTF